MSETHSTTENNNSHCCDNTCGNADDRVVPDSVEINPLFARPKEAQAFSKFTIPQKGSLPETAYQVVHDEAMLDGNARLNLATFVSTWMDDHANRLYMEAADKNMIDKDEYPKTAEVESRCWHMLADLWHAPDPMNAIGTSTIGVVAIMGVTYTGMYEPVEQISEALDRIEERTGLDVRIHVDGASGGMIAPFIQPDLAWDFRVKRVYSISTSGHKYGLVYPGLGWVVWRETADLPESLIFKVSYLGGEMPTFALNFSRPGAQVLLQYYMFLRLGFDGYRRVQQTSHDVAKYLSGEIEQMDDFTLWNDGSDIPVFAWMLNDKPDRKWNLYDLQDRLRMKGWLVPAYPMPVDLTQVTVQRIVVRNGFSHDMAEAFIKDLKSCVKYLDGLRSPMPSEARASGFHH